MSSPLVQAGFKAVFLTLLLTFLYYVVECLQCDDNSMEHVGTDIVESCSCYSTWNIYMGATLACIILEVRIR